MPDRGTPTTESHLGNLRHNVFLGRYRIHLWNPVVCHLWIAGSVYFSGLIQPLLLAKLERTGVGIDSGSFYEHKSADHGKWGINVKLFEHTKM